MQATVEYSNKYIYEGVFSMNNVIRQMTVVAKHNDVNIHESYLQKVATVELLNYENQTLLVNYDDIDMCYLSLEETTVKSAFIISGLSPLDGTTLYWQKELCFDEDSTNQLLFESEQMAQYYLDLFISNETKEYNKPSIQYIEEDSIPGVIIGVYKIDEYTGQMMDWNSYTDLIHEYYVMTDALKTILNIRNFQETNRFELESVKTFLRKVYSEQTINHLLLLKSKSNLDKLYASLKMALNQKNVLREMDFFKLLGELHETFFYNASQLQLQELYNKIFIEPKKDD